MVQYLHCEPIDQRLSVKFTQLVKQLRRNLSLHVCVCVCVCLCVTRNTVGTGLQVPCVGYGTRISSKFINFILL